MPEPEQVSDLSGLRETASFIANLFSKLMASPPKSIFRIIMILLAGYGVGTLAATIYCYLQPKIYESRAVLTEEREPGGSTALPGPHAARAVSDLMLHRVWDLSFKESVLQLQQGVTITSTPAGTVIEARFDSASDARQIADYLSKSFPGFDRERQWSAVEGLDDYYFPKEIETSTKLHQLRQSILESLKRTGNDSPGILISETTVARIDDADLTRQFEAYQATATPPGRFAPPDGQILTPLPLAAIPIVLPTPVSPNVEAAFLTGRISGLLAAAAVLAWILARRPSLVWVSTPKPAKSPDWADVQPLPSQNRFENW
ncbi:hypothetical protein [Haloferula sp.]|uniref:hypothetical protein n=1 Tax=Haloferula sp. TaxID=2497595 RepID=UPI003C789F5E